MTEDSLAYAEVMEAYKLPKTTEVEIKTRQEAIEHAFQKAIEIPIQTLNACVECLYLIAEVAFQGNPSAFSDLKVAEYLCLAGAKGALENIEINFPSLKNPEYMKQTETKVKKLRDSLEQVSKQKIAKPV